MKYKIREARERAGYTQTDLAKIIGVAPNTFNGYENGIHDPKSDLLVKIAHACDTTVDFLLGRSENSAPTNAHLPITQEERTLLSKYRTLDPSGRTLVDWVVAHEADRVSLQKPAAFGPDQEAAREYARKSSQLNDILRARDAAASDSPDSPADRIPG